MSESKYTPGPWTIEPNPREIDIAPAFQNTLQVIAFAGTEDEEFIAELSHEANARLIAAAPETKEQRDELLEACKEAFGVLTEPGIMDVDKWKGWRKLTVAKLREAIDKAEKPGT